MGQPRFLPHGLITRSAIARTIAGTIACAAVLGGCGRSEPLLSRADVGAVIYSGGGSGATLYGSTSMDESLRGTIGGRVLFEGPPPPRRAIDTASAAFCSDSNRDAPLLSETFIVSAEGGFENVFVYIKSGIKAGRFPPPAFPVILDQKGCSYHPHVAGIQKGQGLRIRNSDPILHNIHALHLETKKDLFNFGQAKAGQEDTRTLQRTGMVKIKCDVHGWMGSYLGVLDHPFHAVTGEDGRYEISGVPPGKYLLAFWHESLGEKTVEVVLGDNAVLTQDQTFSR